MMVNRLLGYVLSKHHSWAVHANDNRVRHHAIMLMPSCHHATDANRSLPEDSNVRHVHRTGSDPVIGLIIGLGRDRS